jgi:hypothetical protein
MRTLPSLPTMISTSFLPRFPSYRECAGAIGLLLGLLLWAGGAAADSPERAAVAPVAPEAEQVAALRAASVDAGNGHTCVIQGSTVRCWGLNDYYNTPQIRPPLLLGG